MIKLELCFWEKVECHFYLIFSYFPTFCGHSSIYLIKNLEVQGLTSKQSGILSPLASAAYSIKIILHTSEKCTLPSQVSTPLFSESPRLDVLICNFTSFQKVQIFSTFQKKNHVPLQIKEEGAHNFGQFPGFGNSCDLLTYLCDQSLQSGALLQRPLN